MRERRSTIRIPVGVEGTYEMPPAGGGPRLGLTQDISLGGMRLVSTERLQPGDCIQISIPLPIQGPVSMRGVVVWSREASRAGQAGYECGLRWTEINTPSQARLNAFITGHTRTEWNSFSLRTDALGMTPSVRLGYVAVVSFLAAAVLLIATFLTLRWIQLDSEAKALRRQLAATESLLSAPRR